MKRKLLVSMLMLLCLLLSLSGTALASAGNSGTYVADGAGLLSAQEREKLEAMAAGIAQSHGCAAYILTVDDYREYGGGDIYDTAMDIYDGLGLGYGQEKNGILLLLSMEERDFAMVTYGELSHRSFTDYGQKYIEDSFLEYFRDNDWYGGFKAYLDSSESLLVQAEAGTPYDVDSAPGGFNFLIVLIPLITAGAVCGSFAYRMKSARIKTEARDYVPGDGVDMRIVHDRFIHRSVVRQKIETQKSGGTSVNSRGFSGRSGKF